VSRRPQPSQRRIVRSRHGCPSLSRSGSAHAGHVPSASSSDCASCSRDHASAGPSSSSPAPARSGAPEAARRRPRVPSTPPACARRARCTRAPHGAARAPGPECSRGRVFERPVVPVHAGRGRRRLESVRHAPRMACERTRGVRDRSGRTGGRLPGPFRPVPRPAPRGAGRALASASAPIASATALSPVRPGSACRAARGRDGPRSDRSCRTRGRSAAAAARMPERPPGRAAGRAASCGRLAASPPRAPR